MAFLLFDVCLEILSEDLLDDISDFDKIIVVSHRTYFCIIVIRFGIWIDQHIILVRKFCVEEIRDITHLRKVRCHSSFGQDQNQSFVVLYLFRFLLCICPSFRNNEVCFDIHFLDDFLQNSNDIQAHKN